MPTARKANCGVFLNILFSPRSELPFRGHSENTLLSHSYQDCGTRQEDNRVLRGQRFVTNAAIRLPASNRSASSPTADSDGLALPIGGFSLFLVAMLTS